MLLIVDKSWSIVTLVIWVIAAIIIVASMARGPIHRTALEWSSFITSLLVIIYYIVVLITMGINSYSATLNSISLMIFLYSVYTSFAFLPGLIALRRISIQKEKKFGVYAAFLGFFWVSVMAITGIVLAAINGEGKNTETGNGFPFLMLGYCGLLPFVVLLIIIKPTRTITVYSLFLILSVMCILIILFSPLNSMFSFFIVNLILVDLPTVGAVICAAIYGYSWKEVEVKILESHV